MKKLNALKNRGFTLIEMLVVAAIISILLGLSAATMKGLASSKGVKSGIPILKGVFEEARQLAIGSGNNVRVVIYVDAEEARGSDEELEKFCRFVGVAQYFPTKGSDEPVRGNYVTESGVWKLSSPGIYLPQKCYFDVDKSRKDADGNPYLNYWNSDGGGTGDTCDVFLHADDANAVACFFYEFNGLGIPSNPRTVTRTNENSNRAPRVILTSGRLKRKQNSVELDADGDYTDIDTTEARSYMGFILTKHGEFMDYDNLDDILNETP